VIFSFYFPTHIVHREFPVHLVSVVAMFPSSIMLCVVFRNTRNVGLFLQSLLDVSFITLLRFQCTGIFVFLPHFVTDIFILTYSS